ncbi:hypothetical protein FND36_02990 [Lachnospiraceae bacterium KGMB03038]|nr:hypothetical protein FND36_02990 [Lachnospiraceae bacterium KGMB03038]
MENYISRQEHDEFVKRMQDEHKRIHYRITDTEKKVDKIYDLTSSVERLATSIESMAKEQKEQGERLEELEARDGETWRKVKWYILTLAIGAVAGAVFTMIGF